MKYRDHEKLNRNIRQELRSAVASVDRLESDHRALWVAIHALEPIARVCDWPRTSVAMERLYQALDDASAV